jgi:acyl carrier protein
MARSCPAGNLAPMLSYQETLQTTCELLQHRVERPRDIAPGDRIQEDLGLDSLALMELSSDVESRFGVSIPSEMYDRILTVEDLARAVIALETVDASANRGVARSG